MPDEQNDSELPGTSIAAGKGVYPIEDPTTANAAQAASIVLAGAGLAATAASTSPDGGEALEQGLLSFEPVLHSMASTLGFTVDSPALLAIGLALGTLGLVLNVYSYRLHRRIQGQWNMAQVQAVTPDTGRENDPRVSRSMAG